jgi:DNA polymerase III subunit gamma/tau
VQEPFKRHEPLYLKYRPQSLADLVGQDGVRRTLENAIQNDRLCHAYLFTGPRGTGKTSSARILAKSLNCKTAGRPTVSPCQTCSCCLEITDCISPAVFEIDAASNNSVDDARILIERAPLVAVGGEYKVYIIDECHMLSKEAFNALLKTIEQPPKNVVFILATTEEHKVLPTIISRCQRLMFRLINQEDLTRHLRFVAEKEGIEIEDEALQLIVRRSGGGLRDALGNLDQASLLARPGFPATVSDLLHLMGALHEDVLLDLSRQIAGRAGQSVIDSVYKFLGEGREPQVVLQELARHFLNLIKASYLAGANAADLSALKAVVLGSNSYLEGLCEQTSLFERSELSQIIEQLDRLEQTCRYSSQPAMHLEIGLLSICHRHDIYLLKDLLERVRKLEEQAGAVSTGLQPAAAAPSRPAPHVQQAAPPAAPARPTPTPAARTDAPRPQESPPAAVEAPLSSPVPRQVSQPTDRAPAAAEPAPPVASSQDGQEGDSDDPRLNELNADIEYFWQQVLDELQRRHLPTFSLASTHAFPIRIGEREVTLGVMKENFQKMLESKIDHLRVACKTVSGMDLDVRIRVAEAPARAKKQSSPARPVQSRKESSPAGQAATASEPSDSAGSLSEAPPQSQSASDSRPAAGSAAAGESTGEVDSSLMKEAYKLFEGPGSRRIN